MNAEEAQELFEHGGNIIILGMPPRTEFGIDKESWQVGEKFKGIKMIPPGLHFIYFSATSKEGQTAPRTGFFHYFKKGEVLVKKYDESKEDLEDELDVEKIERIKANLKDLDRNLGPYPFDSWAKWISFSQYIEEQDLLRLQPLNGRISSVPELVNVTQNKREHSPDETAAKYLKTDVSDISNAEVIGKLPDMEPKPGTEIRFSKICTQPHKFDATPNEVTRCNIDSSFTLFTLLENLSKPENLLAELQFSFICFLVGQVWDSWEHWRKLLMILCKAEEFLKKYPDFYLKLLSILHYQIEEVPEDLFADIVESNNFLVAALTNLFSNIEDNEAILPQELVMKQKNFSRHLSSKFQWNLSYQEEGEDAPVVVDLG